MSKRILSLLLAALLITSIGAASSVSAAVKSNDKVDIAEIGAEIDPAFTGDNDFDPASKDSGDHLIDEADKLPASIDLRDYNGINYVTPVKFQNPFGTCWAFGIAGASEISYLYDNGLGVPAGEVNNSVDFSEKYTAWYIYHGITEDDVTVGAVRASQVGEGYDPSEAESSNINAVYNIGGFSAYASSFYASGCGPVLEDYDVDGWYPYYYAGKNLWRQCDRDLPDFVAPIRQAYFKEYYRSNVQQYIDEGYIQSADEYDEWFDENWGEGFFLYTKSYSRSNYAGFDDWSLPLNAEYRFPGVVSYFQSSTILPEISVTGEDGNYEFQEIGLAAIKLELSKGHGVAISYLADQSLPGQELGDTGYMNTTNWAQYYNGPKRSNHCVTVVGYDDNYPKENFTRIARGEVVEGSTPPGDGALIVKNSWGALTEEDKATVTYDIDGNPVYVSPDANGWGYEDSGYFYLSYYDHGINSAKSFQFYKMDEIKHDEMYYDQYDLLQVSDYEDFPLGTEVKMANIFDAEENEFLSQISFMTTTPLTAVHYEIYKDVEDDDPSSGIKLEEGDSYHMLGGYQRIDLKKEYFLHKGEKYSVVITQTFDFDGSDQFNLIFPYALEMVEGVKLTGVINEGESYFFVNDDWNDISDPEWKDYFINAIYQELIKEEGSEEAVLAFLPKGKDGIAIDNLPIKAFLAPASLYDLEFIVGDADLDDTVDITDVTTIQRCEAEFAKLDYVAATLADVDKDLNATVIDATWIQRYLVDMKAPDCIDKPLF